MSAGSYPRIVGEYAGTVERPVYFKLTEPAQIELSDGSILVIPAGYSTNYASIPRFLWSVLPPLGIGVTPASLAHDYLYAIRKLPIDWNEKKRADLEFKYLLDKYNPTAETANKMMYVAVKLFGRPNFVKGQSDVIQPETVTKNL